MAQTITQDGCNFNYYSDDGQITISGVETNGSYVVFPNEIDGSEVTSLYIISFPNCVKKIYIPPNIKSIFHGFRMSNVEFVDGCAGLEGIYSGAFELSSLKEIHIGNKIRLIGDQAFKDCAQLSKVEGGYGVFVIGSAAFENCKSLETLDSFSNLYYLGERAFKNSGLKHFYVSDCLEDVGREAFNGCSTRVTYTPQTTPHDILCERKILKRKIQQVRTITESRTDYYVNEYACISDMGSYVEDNGDFFKDIFITPLKYDNIYFFVRNLQINHQTIVDYKVWEIRNDDIDTVEVFINCGKLNGSVDMEYELGIILPFNHKITLGRHELRIVDNSENYETIYDYTDDDYDYEDDDDDEDDEDDNSDGDTDEYADSTINYDVDGSDPSTWDAESVLRKQGYSVSVKEGLSSDQRRHILKATIDSGILSKHKIIRHIEAMIHLRRGQDKYHLAIRKWNEDLDYLRTL